MKKIKMKQITPFTSCQDDQLKEIMFAATELMEEVQDRPLSEAFEPTLIRLQQKYPLVMPMLLLEAIYIFIESNPRFDAKEKREARSSRKECKDWRMDIYDNLSLTFNV